MRYFTSRDLSEKLSINLAKWKRWVREFLPPDPLGGLQSGYARQLTMEDAFIVFLGGCLVGELKVPMSEAKPLMADLQSWFDRNDGFAQEKGNKNAVVEHVIIISHDLEKGQSVYVMRHILSCTGVDAGENRVFDMRYFDETIRSESSAAAARAPALCTRSLSVTRIHEAFIERLAY